MKTMDDNILILGYISGLYGVKGWVRIFSYTEQRETIFNYHPWQIYYQNAWQLVEIEGKKSTEDNLLLVKFKHIEDRTKARDLLKVKIGIDKTCLPKLPDNQYYWHELKDLKVYNLKKVFLGVVIEIMETGANDVLVVKGEQEHLIPYVLEHVVISIDVKQGVMQVDWDENFHAL